MDIFTLIKKLCDRIAFIYKGKILKIGTQEEVKDLVGSGIIIEITSDKGSQELISDLIDHNFILENSER